MTKFRKYKMINLIWVSVKCAPLQASFRIIYTIVEALMPAYQTLAIAGFINCAIDIFAGEIPRYEVFLPIGLIVLYFLYVNIMPNVANLVAFSHKNKLTIATKKIILDKRAAIEYKHIENIATQELINRVCTDPARYFFDGFNNILTSCSLTISTVSVLSIIMSSAFWSGIIVIFISMPLMFASMKTGRQNYEMGIEAQKVQRKYRYLFEVLTSREFAHERSFFKYSSYLQKKFSELYDQSYVTERKIEEKSYANMKSGSLITLVIIAGIIVSLIPSLNNGEISIGVFIALVNAVFGLVQGMSWRLSGNMRIYAMLKEYLSDLNVFLELSEKKDAVTEPKIIENFIFETLEFRKVTFRYPDTQKEVLKDCSFIIRSGKSYAFVGANGAGKSTIIKLMAGLYDDYSGEILINGKNIKEYDFSFLKYLLAVAFQDFTRYSISILENIQLGNYGEYDGEKICDVLKQVELENWIKELKKGINTNLGKDRPNGIDISEGQWQRIVLARLLYGSSKIMILDEPTAALDPIAESNVYKLFATLSRKQTEKTTIYITHRLGAAKNADVIFVVNNGQIDEIGSHQELIGMQNGLYKRMFESQRGWYE